VVVVFGKGSEEGADPNCGPGEAAAGAAPNRGWLEVASVDEDDVPNINVGAEVGGGIVVVADPKVPDACGAGAADVDVPKPAPCPNACAPNIALGPIPT
jgi:hypothetical protein